MPRAPATKTKTAKRTKAASKPRVGKLRARHAKARASKSQSPTEIVERLRRICMALPEANERVSHGEPTWFAGKGKVFAMLDNHHHGAAHIGVWLPQPLGAQEALIDHDPTRFFRPPYVGVHGWIGVVLDHAPDWNAVASLVRDAYVHVAARKLIAQLQPDER